MSTNIDHPFNACMFKQSCLKLQADRDALLEALKAILAESDGDWWHNSLIAKQARAAIAQAEKETKP
jgi:hypothetical protein